MLLVTTVLAMTLSGQAVIPDSPDVQPSQPPQPQAQPEPKAQDPQEQQAEAKEPPTPPHTGIRALFGDLGEDIKHLPALQNLYLATIGGGLAAAAHPADQTLNARLVSNYDTVNTAFAAGKYIGNTPEQVALSIGTYAFGRIFKQPKTSHLARRWERSRDAPSCTARATTGR